MERGNAGVTVVSYIAARGTFCTEEFTLLGIEKD